MPEAKPNVESWRHICRLEVFLRLEICWIGNDPIPVGVRPNVPHFVCGAHDFRAALAFSEGDFYSPRVGPSTYSVTPRTWCSSSFISPLVSGIYRITLRDRHTKVS
jgi:hypothetical protein